MAARKTIRTSLSPPRSAKADRVTAHYIRREPSNIQQLVAEMQRDEQFVFGVSILARKVKTAQVTVEASDDNPRAAALADHLTDCWYQYVDQFTQAIEFGRVAFEKVFRFDSSIGHVVDELIPLVFSQSKMKLDDTGRFAGVDYDKIHFTADESLWVAVRATALEPHGRSIYLGAPQRILRLRKEHEKREEIWYRRFSIGRGIGRAPSDYESPTGVGKVGEVNQDGTRANPMADLKRTLEDVESGGDIVLSSARDPNGQYLFEYTPGNDLKDGEAIESRRRMLDTMALRSLGIPDRAITQDGAANGSRAVADAHGEVLADVVEGILSDLIECYQSQIIDYLCRVNGLAEGSLSANYRPMSDNSEARADEIVRAAIQSPQLSPIIAEGVIDFPKLVEMSGLPMGADAPGALQRIAARAATAALPSPSSPTLFSHFHQSSIDRRTRTLAVAGTSAA